MQNCDRAMGKHGCGEINDNGERLVDFYLNNNVIGATIVPHKNIHKFIWRSWHNGQPGRPLYCQQQVA